jgi:hypothetical protein
MTGASFVRELAIHAGPHQVRVLSAFLSPLVPSTAESSSSKEDGHIKNPAHGDGNDDNSNVPVSTADLSVHGH